LCTRSTKNARQTLEIDRFSFTMRAAQPTLFGVFQEIDMTKVELLNGLSQRTGEAQVTCDLVLKALRDMVHEAVAHNERLTLPGIGVFEQGTRAARKGRNVRTGEEITIPEKNVPKFRAAKALKDAVPQPKKKARK
jgi:DNA-binding protein HU-beta